MVFIRVLNWATASGMFRIEYGEILSTYEDMYLQSSIGE
jgi:hypothetical protein